MRWPRGKYNGRRIEGFRLHFVLHVLDWYWKPLLHWNHGEPRFSWLCFTWMACAQYVYWDI
jgi:hypothetical protein